MSAIGLDRRSYLEVILNDKSLPLEVMRFGGILLSEHHLYHLPCGQLAFTDPLRLTNSAFTPADGSKLVIRIGPNSDSVSTYTFRLFNVQTDPEGTKLRYRISFIADYPQFFFKSGDASIEGGTNDALSEIASRSGLKFDGIQTNDHQVWLPFGEPECRFARRISTTGYIDDQSCMLLGVAMDGTMRYANLNSKNFAGNLPLFVQGRETGGIFCTSWEGRSLSGATNFLGGYRASLRHYDPIEGLTKSAQKVTARKISKSLNVNKEIREQVGDGRTVVLPINAGNKHKNALKARNQNARLALFLAQSVSVITPFQTKVRLFDPIYFQNYLMDNGSTADPDPNTSGPYMVAGRAVYIGPDLNYVERLQFIRDGYGNDKSRVLS